MEQLEHALKVLSFVLRNPEMDTSLLQPPPFRSKKTLSMHRPLDYNSYRNRTASQPVLRERCVACQQVYRNGSAQLVRHSDPEVYKRPRWRAVPSGRYVSPPLFALKLSNPALHSLTELGSKTTSTTFTSRKASSSKAGLPTVSDSHSALSMLAANTHDSAGGGGGGGPEDGYYTNDTSYSTAPASRVNLYALKNRNNTEAEILKKRMREFIDSLPPKEPPLVPARIKAT
ncbi:uncharacterized protein [Littorina saxatilis]|uniref:Uncharacterized protein n=1 Tax=Littorina saxatilis TaxID=31220 RepID=A0AAN9BKX5_9CAEN